MRSRGAHLYRKCVDAISDVVDWLFDISLAGNDCLLLPPMFEVLNENSTLVCVHAHGK